MTRAHEPAPEPNREPFPAFQTDRISTVQFPASLCAWISSVLPIDFP